MNLDELNKKLDETTGACETWNPKEVGEKILGVITEIGSMSNKFGGESHFVRLKTPEGKVLHIWAKTVIRSALQRQEAKVGDVLGLKYLGKMPGKNYQNFGVLIEKQSQDNYTPY